MMNHSLIILRRVNIIAVTLFVWLFTSASDISNDVIKKISTEISSHTATTVYAKLHLKELGLSESAYNLAINGCEKLKAKGDISKNILSICDFTQSSNHKRLYVIDLNTGTLLFNTLVAHGRNTGEEFANLFSNISSSNQSSLGFFTTENTYQGAHGLSLKLKGLEPGFNDEAGNRAIVMHSADYVSETFITKYGRLGRSLGCPSIPAEQHEAIINLIKNGTCLFIYYPDKQYLSFSKLIK